MKQKRQSLKLLVKAGISELLRDTKLLFFTIFFPFFFLLMFAGMSFIIPNSETLGISLIEFMFPGIIVFALVSTGFYGTVMPLVELRANGTIRLFSLSPLKSSIFLLSQIIVRLAVSIVQISLFIVIGLLFGIIQWYEVIPLFVVSIIGMTMILALSFLLGGMFSKAEIAGGVLGGISAPLLMLSGVLMPFYIMPDLIQKIAYVIPFTYMGEALRQIMFDNPEAIFNVYINCLIVLAFTAIFFVIAQKTFSWAINSDKT